MEQRTEAELVACCRRGEPGAWDEFFARHYAATGQFLFQLSSSFAREDVEELCQETFLSAIRGLGEFKGQSRIQTWLFRIASNKARDWIERRSAAKRGGGQAALSLDAPDPATGLALDPPSAAPGPDAQLAGQERHLLVQQALELLNPPCREVIELRYFGDLSYEEIAAALDLNPKTVSSRLSKCLDRLGKIARNLADREKAAPFTV